MSATTSTLGSQPIRFYSARHALAGDLFLPGGRPPSGGWPAVVVLSGYQGYRDIHPARFARALTGAGYACLGFDYRGFGDSEGEPGRLVPQEQVEDTRAALGYLEGLDEIDQERIALLGWALGGGVAVAAAADDNRVRAVVAVNAVANGRRVLRNLHDESSWERLLSAIADDRRNRAITRESRRIDPFTVLPLDASTQRYVDEDLYRGTRYTSVPVTVEAVEALLRFKPEDAVPRIAPRPLLVVHGSENQLHPPLEAEALIRHAGEPKRLVLLEGRGHTEWMYDDHPTFHELVRVITGFLYESTGGDGEEPNHVYANLA